MKKQYIILSASILLLILWSSCSQEQSHEDEHDQDHAEEMHDEHEDELALTQEQIANVNLQFGQLEERNIVSSVQMNGRIELPPQGRATVSSLLGGQIQKVHVIPGQQVKKGQTLFSLMNMELLDWYQEYQEAQSRIDYLTTEENRLSALQSEQLSSSAKVKAVTAEKKQLLAKQAGINSRLRSIGLSIDGLDRAISSYTVKSPIAGVIQHLPISIGAHVTPSDILAEVIDDHHLHLHLQAYGSELAKLQQGQKLNFYVPSRPEDIRSAEIYWINNMVNEETNSYDVHAELSGDSDGLYSGEYVEARIIDENRKVLSLPISAVTRDKGLQYIFVKEEEHEKEVHFLKIQVNTGAADLGYVEILPVDPLPTDAEIVTENAFFLMAQSKKGEEGVGHHH